MQQPPGGGAARIQRLHSAQQRAHGLTSAANETGVERPGRGLFCDSAFSTSAPAAHALSTKTHAAVLHDVNAFSAARIRQRKLRYDSALLSNLTSTHLLAHLTHLRCARRRMRVNTVFGMLSCAARGAFRVLYL